MPALIWLCRFDPPKAAGTSLAVLIPPIGLPAAMKAYEESRVDLTAAICIAAAFTVGAYFGAAIVNRIPPLTLRLSVDLPCRAPGGIYTCERSCQFGC